jgi:hypothetical protein
MRLLVHIATVLLVTLLGLARTVVAQGSDIPYLEMALEQLRIHDITKEESKVTVRGSRVEADRSTDRLIICAPYPPERYRPELWYLAIQDLTLRTDDRIVVEPAFCDALLAAAQRRKDAQDQ